MQDVSTSEIEKLCKTDKSFMYLLDRQLAPSHMTIDNFMNHCLSESIDKIFKELFNDWLSERCG
ncbi:MAG: transposase [Acutalibacteraceae bacterium]